MEIDKFLEPVKTKTMVYPFYDQERIKYLDKHQSSIIQELKTLGVCKNLDSLPSQIKKLRRKKSSTLTLTSHYTHNNEKVVDGFGRLQPTGFNDVAMVSITRPIRQFLVRQVATDIDIKNAHPEFMSQIYRNIANEEMPGLAEWNLQREDIFKRVIQESSRTITRDDAKSLAFIFMYDGSVDKRFIALGLNREDPNMKDIYDLMNKLGESARTLANWFEQKRPNFWHSLYVDESKEEKRYNASRLSKLFQHIEKLTVLQMVSVANIQGFRVLDICHDGLLLSKEEADGLRPLTCSEISDFCSACMSTIRASLGLSLTIISKDMDDPYVNALEKKFNAGSGATIPINEDDEAVKIFIERFKGRLVFCNLEWYIRPLDEFFWRSGENSVCYCIGQCNFVKRVGDDYKPYSGNAGGRANIFKILKHSIPDLTNDNFITDNNDITRGLIYFKDKHYDIKKQIFIPNDISSSVAPIVYCNRLAPDFKEAEKNFAKLRDLTQNLTDIQFGEYCHIVGRMIAGYVTDKKWLMLTGARDTGKSTLTNLIANCFKDYVCHTPSPFSNKANTDDGAKMRWTLTSKCHIARVAIGAERETMENQKGELVQRALDGGMIKKVIANGWKDCVSARLHRENETKIKINTGFIFGFNGIPTAEPADAMKTCIVLQMDIQYTHDYAISQQYPEVYKMKSQEFSDYAQDEKVQECFIWCVLSKYYKDYTFEPLLNQSTAEQAEELNNLQGEVRFDDLFLKYYKCSPKEEIDRDDVLDHFRTILKEPLLTASVLTRKLKIVGVSKIDRRTNKDFPSGWAYRGLELLEKASSVEPKDCLL